MVIAGDSAGGGLTLAVLATLRTAGDPMPAAAVTISPWTDLERTGDSMRSNAGRDQTVDVEDLGEMARMYLGTSDPKNPLASPLYADFRGFPPLLIQVGAAEGLLDDSTRVAKRAKAAGVEVELEDLGGYGPRLAHLREAVAGRSGSYRQNRQVHICAYFIGSQVKAFLLPVLPKGQGRREGQLRHRSAGLKLCPIAADAIERSAFRAVDVTGCVRSRPKELAVRRPRRASDLSQHDVSKPSKLVVGTA